jgi:hypothetical protein
MNDFEVAEVLERMAELTGHAKDVLHWRKLIRQDSQHVRLMFDQRWEANGNENFFMGPKNGMLMTNGFWAMRSKHFPREYADKMVRSWALNRDDGFLGAFFPLAMSKKSMKKFSSGADLAFGYTPDTAYFTLDGMFRQGLAKTASELTLNHLENYNYHEEWGIPVAPEAYRRDLSLFGDQYSNFNAGKILLFLEGLAGISYSLPGGIFKVRDAMPTAWEWMELEIPLMNEAVWTKVRINRQEKAGGITKKITVWNCPLRVKIEPWLEERKLEGTPESFNGDLSSIVASRPDRPAFESAGKTTKSSVTVFLK